MHLKQGRFVGTHQPTEEVLLELVIPLNVDRDRFRVGWSLRGLGPTGWIAITTGEEVWNPSDMSAAAEHVRNLLQDCWAVVSGEWAGPRD